MSTFLMDRIRQIAAMAHPSDQADHLDKLEKELANYRPVLRDWVCRLSLRAQGTLLTNIRSCDLSPKHPDFICENNGCSTGEQTADRQLTAFLRWCVMVPADEREVDLPGAFMRSVPPDEWKPSQFGHYPLHWVMHIVHGFQVVAYHHDDSTIRTTALSIYNRFVHSFHLMPESGQAMINRFNEDRIAAGNVVS